MTTLNQVGNALTGASGTGAFAGNVSPSFTTPALGTPSSGTLSSCTGYATASLTGLGTGVATALAINVGTAGSPVVNGGALGTPSGGTLTSCSGLPISGIASLGTNVATALASTLNGTGALAGTTSPIFVTPALGTPSSGNLSNCTGAPLTGAVILAPSGDQVIVGSFALGTYNLTASNQVIAGDVLISGDTIRNNTTNNQLNILAFGTSLVSIGTALLFAPAASGTQKYLMQVAQLNVDASVGIGSFTASSNGPRLDFTKSRNTSPGSHNGLNNGDILGTLLFNGDDNVSYLPGAQIQVTATTGVTTGHVPGQMVFSTSSASTANVTAMTISNAQIVTLANALPVTSGGTGVTSSTGSTSVVLSTSPSITTPKIVTGLNDENGNQMLAFLPVSSAINYLTIENGSTGLGATLFTSGSETDVPLTIQTKGAGVLTLAGLASSNQFVFKSASSHTTAFNFPTSSFTAQTITVPDATGTMQLSGASSLITAPAASQASSLSIGSAYQNPFGYDVLLTIYYSVSSATTASILVGVGSTNTPTQQTVISGLTLAALGIITIPIYLPSGYYALVSTSGTITAAISGQQAMPV